MEMKQLLLITPGFAADENDHNCIPPLQGFVRELQRRGVAVHIVALEYPFTDQSYNWHGAQVYPCNGRNRRWFKPRTIWRAMGFCHDVLDMSDISVIHSFWLGIAWRVGERIAQRRGVPHVTTLMGQDVLPGNRRYLRMLTPAHCGRLIALSPFHDSMLEKATGYRAGQVIPWGVETTEIPSKLPSERSLDVLGVGSLVAVKNWSKWLRVLAKVSEKHPGLRAELMGDGPERAALERLAATLGLAGRVHFAGTQPRREVLRRMQQARVLLHTSHFESFGFVLAEAAMEGCRVVSTPVGIAPELCVCAADEGGLATLVSEGLVQPPVEASLVPFRMKDTVRLYAQLGFSLK